MSIRIKHTLLLFISLVAITVGQSAYGQTPAGRSASVTLFADFQPGVVTLADGHKSRQSKVNIFLKNSTLVYKQGNSSVVMEALMETIKQVEIAGRTFLNLDGKLAELVATDSVSHVQLVRIRTVDVEAMKAEESSNSTVSNLEFSTASLALNVARREDFTTDEPYLLVDNYYYLHHGKKTHANERDIKVAIGRKRRTELESILSYTFSWGSEQSLIDMMKLFR